MPLCFQSPRICCGGMHEVTLRRPSYPDGQAGKIGCAWSSGSVFAFPSNLAYLGVFKSCWNEKPPLFGSAFRMLPSQEGKEDAGSCWPRMTPRGMCQVIILPSLSLCPWEIPIDWWFWMMIVRFWMVLISSKCRTCSSSKKRVFTKSFVNALRFDGLKLKLEMSEGSLRSHSLLWNDQVKPLTFSERSQEVLGSLVRQLLHWRNVFSQIPKLEAGTNGFRIF